jgi:hypothetical protein
MINLKKIIDIWCTRTGDLLWQVRLDKDVGFIGNQCTSNVVSGEPKERMDVIEELMHKESTPCVEVRNLVEWEAFMSSHVRCAENFYPDVRLPPGVNHSYYEEAERCNKLALALHKALSDRGEQCFKHYEEVAKKLEVATKLHKSGSINADYVQNFYFDFFACPELDLSLWFFWFLILLNLAFSLSVFYSIKKLFIRNLGASQSGCTINALINKKLFRRLLIFFKTYRRKFQYFGPQ